MKKNERISINEKERWGGLVDPEKHVAAVGARIIDNRRRAFEFCGDRMTEVGDEKVVALLRKWAYGKLMMNRIRKNTRFDYDLSGVNTWEMTDVIGRKKDIVAYLKVRCAGEYVYLQAYADYYTESGHGENDKKEECSEGE